MLDTEVDAARVMRDRAYTHMFRLMEQIRRYGRVVFAKDSSRQELYKSEYYSTLGRSSGASRAQSASAQTAPAT